MVGSGVSVTVLLFEPTSAASKDAKAMPAPDSLRARFALAANGVRACLVVGALLSPSFFPALRAIAQPASCCAKGRQCSCHRNHRVCRCGMRLSPGWWSATEKCDCGCPATGTVTAAGYVPVQLRGQICIVQQVAAPAHVSQYAGRNVTCSFPRAPPFLLS